jgi:hypothetical protein
MEPIGWVTQIEPSWHGAPHNRLPELAHLAVSLRGRAARRILRGAAGGWLAGVAAALWRGGWFGLIWSSWEGGAGSMGAGCL